MKQNKHKLEESKKMKTRKREKNKCKINGKWDRKKLQRIETHGKEKWAKVNP